MADAASRPAFYFAVPGDLTRPTGGYAYARALLANAGDAGISLTHIPLPGSYPAPSPNDIAETERQFQALPATATVLVDGLAFGAMPEALVAGLPQKIVALVHHPLALETGLEPAVAARLEDSERRALAHADAIVITGAETAAILQATYGVASHRITLAEPGVVPRTRARPRPNDMPRLLSVGAVSPRKGYDVLVDAMTRIRRAPWTLDIVGDCDQDPDTTLRLAQQIYRTRQGDRIALLGNVPDGDLDQIFRTSHLFVMPSRFEGYGMVLTEAIAYGLPIVATETTPALKSLPTAAWLGVAADDAAALGDVIAHLLADPARLNGMGEAAWSFATRLPRWQSTAETIARVLKEVA